LSDIVDVVLSEARVVRELHQNALLSCIFVYVVPEFFRSD